MRIRAEIEALEDALRLHGCPERADGARKYLKSNFAFLGVRTPEIRQITRQWLAAYHDVHPRELVRLSRALFSRRLHELKAVAIVLLQERRNDLRPEDLGTIEWMLRRSYSWAYVDALAVHVVGPLAHRFPELDRRLDDWVNDSDFWIRRSALLSHLLPLRQGIADWERFARHAESMLDDHEFFIRKAIGWTLREAGKRDPETVASFVDRHIDSISGVTIREAVKHLEPGQRRALLERYRQQRRGKSSREWEI